MQFYNVYHFVKRIHPVYCSLQSSKTKIKMYKLLALTIIFGVVAAEPVQRRTFSSNDIEYPGYELVVQEPASAIMNIITSIIGYKVSALSIAVSCIEWIVSNFFMIIVGTLSILGFCKFTGKCSLNYDQYIPVTQLQGLVTPENIDTAEKFLFTAVEKYAEKRK